MTVLAVFGVVMVVLVVVVLLLVLVLLTRMVRVRLDVAKPREHGSRQLANPRGILCGALRSAASNRTHRIASHRIALHQNTCTMQLQIAVPWWLILHGNTYPEELFVWQVQ